LSASFTSSDQPAAADKQITCPAPEFAHAPPNCPFGSWHTFAGRQLHVAVPLHAAGTSTHVGGGGSQTGGTQPGPLPELHWSVLTQAVGHWPASPSGTHTATPPPQLACTQTCVELQRTLPHTTPPPAPPEPVAPPAPPRPPDPVAPAEPPRPPDPAAPPAPAEPVVPRIPLPQPAISKSAKPRPKSGVRFTRIGSKDIRCIGS